MSTNIVDIIIRNYSSIYLYLNMHLKSFKCVYLFALVQACFSPVFLKAMSIPVLSGTSFWLHSLHRPSLACIKELGHADPFADKWCALSRHLRHQASRANVGAVWCWPQRSFERRKGASNDIAGPDIRRICSRITRKFWKRLLPPKQWEHVWYIIYY